MIYLSQTQLIRLWSELEQAYFGKNGFGGNTAEIYAYTVMANSPGYYLTNPDSIVCSHKALELQAAQTLYSVLKLFSELRDCNIFVNGRRLGKWFTIMQFGHRVHVQIKLKKGGSK